MDSPDFAGTARAAHRVLRPGGGPLQRAASVLRHGRACGRCARARQRDPPIARRRTTSSGRSYLDVALLDGAGAPGAPTRHVCRASAGAWKTTSTGCVAAGYSHRPHRRAAARRGAMRRPPGSRAGAACDADPADRGRQALIALDAQRSRRTALSCQRRRIRWESRLKAMKIRTPVSEIRSTAANMRGMLRR